LGTKKLKSMGKIYSEVIKADLFSDFTDKYWYLVKNNPFVTNEFGKIRMKQKIGLVIEDVFYFNPSKVKTDALVIYSEIQDFVFENINEFSLIETYCFLTKALTDFEVSFLYNI
jgi:hypothetical protein